MLKLLRESSTFRLPESSVTSSATHLLRLKSWEFWGTLLLLFFISFPTLEPEIAPGLDGSYMWALNYFKYTNNPILPQLVYPIGPLGYLKHPVAMGSNLALAVIFFTCIKLGFLFLALTEGYRLHPAKPFWVVVLTFVVGVFAGFDYCLVGLIYLLLKQESFVSAKKWLAFLAYHLAWMGLFIKTSLGLISFAIIGGVWVIEFLNHRVVAKSAVKILYFSLAGLLTGGFVFRSINLFALYIKHALKLSFSYGTISLHPDNNWFALIAALTCLVLFYQQLSSKQNKLGLLCWALPLFLVWKHAIIREDYYHHQQLVKFTFVFVGLTLLTHAGFKRYTGYAAVGVVLFLHLNMRIFYPEHELKMQLSGFPTAVELFFAPQNFYQTFETQGKKNTLPYVLPKNVKEKLGTQTVDFYPWDLSFAMANKLNWQPRKTLQSGAFGSWLDQLSSQHFIKVDKPQNILLQPLSHQDGRNFMALDNGYLLSDEPHSIYHLLNNYAVDTTTESMLILKQQAKPLLGVPYAQSETTLNWNTWITVPVKQKAVTRLKIRPRETWNEKIRSFVYKPSLCYIDYILEDGLTFTHRISVDNAQDGLWIDPYLIAFNPSVKSQRTLKIRLRHDETGSFEKQIPIQWQWFDAAKFSNVQNTYSYSLAEKALKVAHPTTLVYNSITTPQYAKHFKIKPENNFRQDGTNGITEDVPARGFSSGFEYKLPELNTASALRIFANAKVEQSQNETKFVVVIADSLNNTLLWQSKHFSRTAHRSFQMAQMNITYNATSYKGLVVTLYVWNDTDKPVRLKSFSVKVSEELK